VPRKVPLPLAQAFVVCRTVYQDRRTGEFLLVGPFNGITLHYFPSGFRLSLYAHLTGGHGTYDLALELRDDEDQAVWGWQLPEPIRHDDPLLPHRISLHDVVVAFPRPGRYDLVLMANGEDLAHHALEVTAAPTPGGAE
jgi:hypothetical protein